ncbi:MAG: hypothetical protein ACO29O_07710 [Chitinophagaceae bacterium]
MSSITEIEKILQIFLYQRKAVSLPGIGTFKIERISPKDSDSGKYLWGPVHIIKLDPKIDSNGKEIFAYVSQKLNITEWEAIKLVNEFVTNLKSIVRKETTYKMEGLGNIETNDDGSFRLNSATLQYPFYSRILKPNADIIIADEVPGVEQIELETAYEDTSVYFNDDIPKDRWWVAVLVFLILASIIIAISLTRSDIPFGGRQNRSEVQVTPLQYE